MKTHDGSYSTINRALLSLLVIIIAIVAAPAAAQTRTFTVKNNCSETVWVAGSGSSVSVFNGTSSGGIELLPGATATTTVPDTWSAGRIWGRRNCTCGCGRQEQAHHQAVHSEREFQRPVRDSVHVGGEPVLDKRDRGAVMRLCGEIVLHDSRQVSNPNHASDAAWLREPETQGDPGYKRTTKNSAGGALRR